MTPTVTFTPAQLFAEMEPREFSDFVTFRAALVDCFNERAQAFPSGYSWRQALDWAVRQNVVRREGDRIVIRSGDAT